MRVRFELSEPWGLSDENNGQYVFFGAIVRCVLGKWLVHLDCPIMLDGAPWSYAIPLTRYTGQKYFDDPTETNRTAVLYIIDDETARDEGAIARVIRQDVQPGSGAQGTCNLLTD